MNELQVVTEEVAYGTGQQELSETKPTLSEEFAEIQELLNPVVTQREELASLNRRNREFLAAKTYSRTAKR